MTEPAQTPPTPPDVLQADVRASTSMSMGIPRPPSWVRRLAKLWGFLAFFLIVAYAFRQVLLPFILAITIAYVLAPFVNALARRRVPRGLAVIICYLVMLATMSVFFIAFLPRLSGDFARLAREAPSLVERVQKQWTPAFAHWMEKHFPSLVPPASPKPPEDAAAPGPVGDLPPPPNTVLTVTPMANGDYAITLPPSGLDVEHVDDRHVVVRPREDRPAPTFADQLRDRLVKLLVSLEGQIAGLLNLIQGIVMGVFAFLMQAVLILMVAAYILIDAERVQAFFRGLFPEPYRPEVDEVIAGVDRGLAGVVRGQLFICLINGALTYVGLFVFNVNYKLLLAAVAALFSAIPIFGSIISSIPIVAVAMVSGASGIDVFRGIFMLIWILGIHFIEGNFLSPRIMGKQAKIHPVLVTFALIAGEHTYGLAGALLAVPVASIVQTLFLHFRARTWPKPA
jgi:predicted PurR-regulated permease PerM